MEENSDIRKARGVHDRMEILFVRAFSTLVKDYECIVYLLVK